MFLLLFLYLKVLLGEKIQKSSTAGVSFLLRLQSYKHRVGSNSEVSETWRESVAENQVYKILNAQEESTHFPVR